MPSIAIFGDSGMGKTMITDRFARKIRPASIQKLDGNGRRFWRCR